MENMPSNIRINTGGTTYTDLTGNVWSADAYFTGSNTYSASKPISGTSDPILYQTERWGNQFSYNIPVASSGLYKVNLDFAEIYWSNPGQRVFDVNIEGSLILDNLDLVAQVGANTAWRKSVDVEVKDGVLNIDFSASVDNAKVSAIEVIPSSITSPPLAPIRLEAEKMSLTNYRIESNSSASGSAIIGLVGGPTDETGIAETTFNGPTSTYNVVAGYYDENDGVGRFDVNIGTQQYGWNLDQNFGSNLANAQTLVRRTIATGLVINNGAAIKIQGQESIPGDTTKLEHARFDYIEFIPTNQTSTDSTPPTASLSAANVTTSGGTSHNFTVSYGDNVAVNVSSLDSQDIVVTGPNGLKPSVKLVGVNTNSNGTPRTATYQITAPGGSWDASDNGSYTVSVQANQVSDTSNNYLQSGALGVFTVNINPGTPLTTPGIWDSGAKMSIALGEVSAGVINDKLYVVGEGSNATLAYNLATGTWSSNLATRPFVGHHHAAEVFNGKLYLLGGLGGGAAGKVQIYNPATNSWTLGADMPFAAGSSSSALINGEIYIAGGIIGSSTTDQVAKYNPAINTWTMLASMKQGRNHTAAATDGSKLYVFGGRGFGSGDGNVPANGFDTVQIYDPATNTWISSLDSGSSLKPLPQARGGMGKAAYFNGEFYVMGGETLSGAGATANQVYNRVDIYNPKTNTWQLGNSMPTARHGIFPLVYGNEIYVAGGGTKVGHSSSDVLEIF
ncbi:MAG: hypothetical protein KME32_15600 [Mojavia pulchra JT2-VF2]|jgi:N-acetylneuraminic acid mutarotase|uniref:Uncharacterized protein n=1 Tax=Mojavia pulchra JT2-VF2 TaxID=287848 RepID=A0A951PZJ1_9NOST|nr:hypothetical protein [Mojavia pulchra JT2-VF2]